VVQEGNEGVVVVKCSDVGIEPLFVALETIFRDDGKGDHLFLHFRRQVIVACG
jgi:hypothetical protein